MVTDVITVKYKDYDVGAVSYDTEAQLGLFEYFPSFINTGIELSPIKMPLVKDKIYSFPDIDHATFKGLPGLIADSLPDDFGNAVMNAWIAAQGKPVSDITPLQRLQYTGMRGMGALTYSPAVKRKNLNSSQRIHIEALIAIAQEVLDKREQFKVNLTNNGQEDIDAMMSLLSVGMSAGGARPKAVLAFNEDFTQVRSGQTNAPNDFTHYIMKFDGVSEHSKSQETFGDPMGYGAMEYTYHLLAKDCGIDMMPCRLIDEGKRRHFITERFDRKGNEKIHVQTLNALEHVSYKNVGSYSYAEVFNTARKLNLSPDDAMQLFKRMVFNVIARNHDDHTKNFGFLFNNENKWQLSPAYDLAYSYKPNSHWVSKHWMTLNGKQDNFTRNDFYSFEKISPVFSKRKIDDVLNQTIEVVSRWDNLATEQEVPNSLKKIVSRNLRLSL
ncbi:MAG: type II toxin-antitoxin system HipA family toxin, partial [Enterobacterales bacterium]|nr:type II toxin-antitoxin system HipA family toxin [Enterobacterales bacterium]